MTISLVDIKLLWGRAGGICSKPDCTEDLTALLESGNYVVGEMAHVIGRKPGARRSIPEGGKDTYDNLILLCPTHHKHIDKAPDGTYTIEMLQEWKRKQEELIRNAGKTKRFHNFQELRLEVCRILAANKAIYDAFGPLSEVADRDPNSNMFLIWELRRVDRILPNNRKILNILDANNDLIEDSKIMTAIEKFRIHAEAYEKHVYHRLDSYPLFPSEFSEVFQNA